MTHYSRVLLKAFTGTKRVPNKARVYLLRNYPRVYRFFQESIRRKECPLCGFQFKSRLGFPPHIKSRKCGQTWLNIINKMVGPNKLSEEEIIELINEIRAQNGIDPLICE